MKKILIVLFIMISTLAFAKRQGPVKIAPIEYNGKKYVVNHWCKSSDYKQNGGIIEVWDINTKKLINRILIYKINYKLSLESDVQDIFITSIKLNKKNNLMIILNEKGNKYYLDLKSYKVTLKVE